jgi:thiol-disulfide isomerase/thioredoxin
MSKKDRHEDKRLKKEKKALLEKRRKQRLPLIFGGILLLIAVVVTVGVLSQQYDAAETASVDLYQNAITPEELQKKIDSKEEVYAYFYQPNCEHCKVVSPFLIPMAKEMNKPLFPVNIYNRRSAWEKYNISGTPTLIHFKDGKEVGKIVGSNPEADFRKFLEQQ